MPESSLYDIHFSYDGRRWQPLPRGYRQDGVILERVGAVVVQSIGRGSVVYYRAVPPGWTEPLATAQAPG